ncbi:MAG: hypothetical protein U0792_03400 [Gemmataceae bacterium]
MSPRSTIFLRSRSTQITPPPSSLIETWSIRSVTAGAGSCRPVASPAATRIDGDLDAVVDGVADQV